MADLDLQRLASRSSHLERAVLRILTTPSNAAVTREQFDAVLSQDEWVKRNEHRLARLESTLAVMAGRGLLSITNRGLAVLPDGAIVAALMDSDSA